MDNNRAYFYMYYLDDEPVYVGCGTYQRANKYARALTLTEKGHPTVCVTDKELKRLQIIIVADCLSKKAALSLEHFLIQILCRDKVLFNKMVTAPSVRFTVLNSLGKELKYQPFVNRYEDTKSFWSKQAKDIEKRCGPVAAIIYQMNLTPISFNPAKLHSPDDYLNTCLDRLLWICQEKGYRASQGLEFIAQVEETEKKWAECNNRKASRLTVEYLSFMSKFASSTLERLECKELALDIFRSFLGNKHAVLIPKIELDLSTAHVSGINATISVREEKTKSSARSDMMTKQRVISIDDVK